MGGRRVGERLMKDGEWNMLARRSHSVGREQTIGVYLIK